MDNGEHSFRQLTSITSAQRITLEGTTGEDTSVLTTEPCSIFYLHPCPEDVTNGKSNSLRVVVRMPYHADPQTAERLVKGQILKNRVRILGEYNPKKQNETDPLGSITVEKIEILHYS